MKQLVSFKPYQRVLVVSILVIPILLWWIVSLQVNVMEGMPHSVHPAKYLMSALGQKRT